MAEFTKEQEAEIQKRIDEARQLEQYRIAGDQGYKEALMHLAGMVDQYDQAGQLTKRGIYDPFVYTVLQNEYAGFRARYFPQKPPAQPEEPAEGDDE